MRYFEKEEMGIVVPESPFIMLSDKFVREHLHLSNYLWRRYTTPIQLDICCPFCKDGLMIIVEMKKDFCEVHECRTGDSYTLRCNNVDCLAFFAYSHTFLYC